MALAQYIRKAFVPNPPQDTKSQLQSFNSKFNFVKGKMTSGQISIEDAMQMVIKDDKPRYKEISDLANLISSQKDAEGAQIFEKVTKNPFEALTTLSDKSSWKADEKEFIKIITDNVNQGGFNGNIFTLSSKQWDILFGYLRAYF